MMSEMDRREALLKQDGYIIGLASLSLINGMHFSPYFSFIAIPFGPILREYGITSPVITFYLASLIVAVGSVIVSGIPAAIFERLTGRQQTDSTSMAVWLGAIFLITIPSFMGLVSGGAELAQAHGASRAMPLPFRMNRRECRIVPTGGA